MAFNIGDFHFLRPWWLLILLPLWFIVSKTFSALSPWQKLVDPHLLPFLLKNGDSSPKKWAKTIPYIFVTLMVLALAGPTAYKLQSDESLNKRPLFILLELSEHMTATDVSPSRLKRALFKISDLLAKEDAAISVIVFAGDAHVVVPLTSDDNTIKELLSSLSSDTMPLKGVRLKPALTLLDSVDLGMSKSSTVIITSSNVEDFEEAKPLMHERHLIWWVFATPQGAPITNDRGEFKKNNQGDVLVSMLEASLKDKVSSSNGIYLPLSESDKDVDFIVKADALSSSVGTQQGIVFDTWVDLGPYLLVVAFLIFLVLAMRIRPWWLFGVILVAKAHDGQTAGFLDYLLRSDQQAFNHLEKQEYDEAAKKYDNADAKGAAYYQAKKYDDAIGALKQSDSSDGQYNLGNAYAQKSQFDKAIAAYEKALTLNPNNEDAAFNKALLEKLKKEQQEQQNNQDKNEQEKKQDNPEKSEDQQNQNEHNADQQKPNDESKSEDKNNKPSDPKSDEKNEQKKPSDKEPKKEQDAVAPPKEAPKKELPPLSPKEQYLLDQVKERNQGQYLKRKFLEETRRNNAS